MKSFLNSNNNKYFELSEAEEMAQIEVVVTNTGDPLSPGSRNTSAIPSKQVSHKSSFINE